MLPEELREPLVRDCFDPVVVEPDHRLGGDERIHDGLIHRFHDSPE